jgi:hypothetical protein
MAVAVDGAGNVYIADKDGNSIRKVNGAGIISTVAGNILQPWGGFTGDGGLATHAAISSPHDVAVDGAGNIYIADWGNNRVRKIDAGGIIHTLAGNGNSVPSGDGGPATGAGMRADSIAVDAAGNIFIADAQNGYIRKVDPSGVIVTVAGKGMGDALTPIGDGGPALQAFLYQPTGVAVDDDGNVYIADTKHARVRRVAIDGTIDTIAGTGVAGISGDGGPPTSAQLDQPWSVRWNAASHSLFVSEEGPGFYAGDGRVRKVVLADTMPAAFTFPTQTSVPLSSLVQSGVVTPTGFDTPASISVTGGEYSIGCTGTFVSTAGLINPGQSVCVRQTSSATANVDTLTTLTIGGVTATFTSTTAVGPGSVSVSAASLDFGAQSMRTDSPVQTVTLTNTGGVSVTVNAVRSGIDFPSAHDCTTLAPGASCTVAVEFLPLGAGAIAESLVLQVSSGTSTVALSGTGERSLTTHYYQSILRRAPDPAGKAYWDAEAARIAGLGANVNEAWFAMATTFYSSAEYAAFNRDDTGFTTDLYETFFNRSPDAGGLAYWTGQLASGMPREVLLASFTFSPEFVNFSYRIFGDTAARAEVDMVMDFYRGLLSRLPDDGGFDFWVGRFRTAQCTSMAAVMQQVDAVSSLFVSSPEYTARNRTNAQYVGDLYNTFMRRGADLTGVLYWVGKLDGGLSRDGLRQEFAKSPEFQFRVGRVASESCLP